MIPFDYITEWRAAAPWTTAAQVEQDLILSRAVVSMFAEPEISRLLAFRGGTALYKLHVRPAARYPEDIDLIYRMISEGEPTIPMRLKVEINSREHFSVFGIEERELAVRSRWFTGTGKVKTYQLDELLGAKLRALYQRKKGRDLFDLFIASRRAKVSPAQVVESFNRHLEHDGQRVTRAELEMNLQEKLSDDTFLSDVAPFVAPDIEWNAADAAQYVWGELLPLLPGEPRKGRE